MNAIAKAIAATIALSALPALGQELDGGIFAGVTTTKDGTHCAVVLLPSQGIKLSWEKAMDWAKEQDGELPSRATAALLFANIKDKLQINWHWTNEEYDASYAWYCTFYRGHIFSHLKSFECSAVAVRLIPITA